MSSFNYSDLDRLFEDITIQDIKNNIIDISMPTQLNSYHEMSIKLNYTNILNCKEKNKMAQVFYNNIGHTIDDLVKNAVRDTQATTQVVDTTETVDVTKLIRTVHINEKKKVVTVVLTDGRKGIARCHDQDIFDTQIGFSMALTYALFSSRTQAIKYVNKCVEKNKK